MVHTNTLISIENRKKYGDLIHLPQLINLSFDNVKNNPFATTYEIIQSAPTHSAVSKHKRTFYAIETLYKTKCTR